MKKTLSIFLLCLSVCACNSSPRQQPLYYWGDYQSALYAYFKDDVPIGTQITAVQQIIEHAHKHNVKVAPGVHAHLGLLYAKQGDRQAMVNELQLEQKLFPEAKPFIDYLLTKRGIK